MAIREHLVGRLRNARLKKTGGLVPVFEAIANAIHAIEETGAGASRGTIAITINRDTSQSDLDGVGDASYAPITGFTIKDSGVGFTTKNYDSFETIDSMSKDAIGGKGIGRLTWLSAFDRARVSSHYRENGRSYHREFEFEPSEEGIVGLTVTEVEKIHETGTTVELIGFRAEYAKRVPVQAEAIGRRIIDHCLTYLILGTCPRLLLIDSQTGQQTDLRSNFKSEVLDNNTSGTFSADGEPFQITHVKVRASSALEHTIHFCAHKRTVESKKLEGLVPNLTPSLGSDDERRFVYYGFVSSDHLDRNVSNDRTSFDLDASSLGEVVTASASEAKAFLSPYTETLASQKAETVKDYVFRRAPRYRHVLKHRPAVLDNIPPGATEDRIDYELYKAQQGYQAELNAEYRRLLAAQDAATLEREKNDEMFRSFLQEWNDAGQDALAEHVMLRAATLNYLDSKREVIGDGSYCREDVIHDVICPMRSTSDDIPADRMNLWIIDERLAFHHYLASDLSFSRQGKDGIPADGLSRPDIIVFDHPMSFVDSGSSYQSVVLIELKRPARVAYPDDDNPYDRMEKYVERLRQGGEVDNKGRPIAVTDNTPFFAFIIADLKPALKALSKRRGCYELPGGDGYFYPNGPNKLWIELWSYQRMIDSAKKRNATFFEKLGVKVAF